MTIIRCPFCNAQGIEHLLQEQVNNMAVVYCAQCGAIHGIVPLALHLASVPTTAAMPQPQPQSPPQPPPQPQPQPLPQPPAPQPKVVHVVKTPEMPPQHAALSDRELTRIVARFTGKKVPLAPNQLEHMYCNATGLHDPAAPRCPAHVIPMIRLTIPPGFPESGQMVWACPEYRACQQAMLVHTSPPAASVTALFDRDLSDKQPYDIAEIAAKMRAMQMYNPGTRYMQIAVDEGGPVCSVHKKEMTKLTVPSGHKNAGRELWVCERYAECQQWELVPLPPRPLPKCAVCHIEMKLLTTPAGHPEAGRKFYRCPNFKKCRQWQEVE